MRTGGSSWPQVNPACPLHGWNRPNGRKLPIKRSLPDVFLTILMELDPPTILPCIVHIMRMIFTFYSVSIWPSWSKICCRKGSGDGSRAVWPATWAKSVKMSKTFPPLEPSLRWLGDGQKKTTFRPLWPKLWGFKVHRIKKWCKSTKFWGRFGGRLTFWPATRAKKVEIQIFFWHPEPWLCWLDDGPKKICILAILARVISG